MTLGGAGALVSAVILPSLISTLEFTGDSTDGLAETVGLVFCGLLCGLTEIAGVFNVVRNICSKLFAYPVISPALSSPLIIRLAPT